MGFLERGAVLTRIKNDKLWVETDISQYTSSRKRQDKRLAALGSFNVFWAWEGQKPQEWTCNEVEKNKTIVGRLLGIFK